jgi:membrane protease YdiL (CAAX protease family)
MKQRIDMAYLAIFLATFLLLLLYFSIFADNILYGSLIFSAILILYEIALPIEILRYCHIKPKDFHIHVYHLDSVIDWFLPPFGIRKVRPDFLSIFLELTQLVKTSVIILIPYSFGYIGFMHLWAIKNQQALAISLTLPPNFLYETLVQIFVVALPEEIFYRGFLQSALLKKWPNKTHHLRFPLGFSIIITNIFFALGHFVNTLEPTRLLTFFPGLIFSYLIYKNKSLISPVLFHTLCNLLGMVLFYSITQASL